MKQQKPRFVTLTMAVALMLSALIMVTGCGGEKAGGGDVDFFAVLPAEVSGVMVLNVKKAATMDFFDKVIADMKEQKPDEKPDQIFANYQDFIDKTGIDPKTDVHGVAIGFYGEFGPSMMTSGPETIALLNINYDQEKMIGFIKKKGGTFTAETYNGVTCFRVSSFSASGESNDNLFGFVDNSLMVGGGAEAVQKTIDLIKGKGGKSLKDNPKLEKHLGDMDTGAIVSFLMALPDNFKKVHDAGMFKVDLSEAQVIIGTADYESGTWELEIKMISPNGEANEQLVNTLNGLKGMGAMAGPEAAELVNNITFSHTADSIKMTVVATQELVEKLQEKVGGAMGAPTLAPPGGTK